MALAPAGPRLPVPAVLLLAPRGAAGLLLAACCCTRRWSNVSSRCLSASLSALLSGVTLPAAAGNGSSSWQKGQHWHAAKPPTTERGRHSETRSNSGQCGGLPSRLSTGCSTSCSNSRRLSGFLVGRRSSSLKSIVSATRAWQGRGRQMQGGAAHASVGHRRAGSVACGKRWQTCPLAVCMCCLTCMAR